MKNAAIKGIIPPIITPFHEDESINYQELRNQVNRMIGAGVHALFPFGTNGEGYILNAEEKKKILEDNIHWYFCLQVQGITDVLSYQQKF